MPPKKDDKKKPGAPAPGAAVVTIGEDELTEAESLPEINDFIFTDMYAFKLTRNQSRLQKAVKKLFSYTNTEDPNFSEELAMKYKTIEMPQLLGQA